MALVELRRFGSSIEASIARSHLLSHGVPSFIFDAENEWDTLDRFDIPVRLMVAEEDLEDAARALADPGGDSDPEADDGAG